MECKTIKKIIPFIAISIILHSLFFLPNWLTTSTKNMIIQSSGIVSIEIITRNENKKITGSGKDKSKKNKEENTINSALINLQRKGKEGNIKKIQKGNIIVQYPKESIYYKEEGVVLIQVRKKPYEKAEVKILKNSPHERLNNAAIKAVNKALLTIKEIDSIDQKLQIEFKLKEA